MQREVFIMCSPTGLICILIASLFYNFIIYPALVSASASASAKADITNSNTATDTISSRLHKNTTSKCLTDGCPQGGKRNSTVQFENGSVYTPNRHLHYGNVNAAESKRNDGHFIDITRKHKIHYNGLVVSCCCCFLFSFFPPFCLFICVCFCFCLSVSLVWICVILLQCFWCW